MIDAEKIKEEVKKNGYTVLKNVFTPAECEHFKSLLDNDYSRYSKYYVGANSTSHGLQDKSGEKVVYNMHNKHPDYMKLFTQPDVLSVVGTMLKDGSYKNSEAFHLLNISARCPLKGHAGQQLHLDSNLPGGDYPIIMIVLYMLDNFTKQNGATRIIPASHRRTGYAEDGKIYDEEVLVEGQQGTALIYNAALWHGGGPNLDGTSRWAVVLGFGRWFIKPSYDFLKCTPISVYDKMTEEQKELFGFNSNPPKDEFTRIRRRSDSFDIPEDYKLPV